MIESAQKNAATKILGSNAFSQSLIGFKTTDIMGCRQSMGMNHLDRNSIETRR